MAAAPALACLVCAWPGEHSVSLIIDSRNFSQTELAFLRQTEKWRNALKNLETGPDKPFLETAPYLLAIFSQRYSYSPNGEKTKHYYVTESIGIATGMLITALHHAGLATLTYTPVNMRFLNKILSRPLNEKPFMILVVGYPSKDAIVPKIRKKALEDISVFI